MEIGLKFEHDHTDKLGNHKHCEHHSHCETGVHQHCQHHSKDSHNHYCLFGPKLTPYWLVGTWKGEGYTPMGDKFVDTTTFKPVHHEPDVVLQYTQNIMEHGKDDSSHCESGFWTFERKTNTKSNVSCDIIHDFGIREQATGKMHPVGMAHYPYFSVEAMEEPHFHRPQGHLESAEKAHHGGMVTHYKRTYWLDEENYLCYEMMMGLEGHAMKIVRNARLSKVDDAHKETLAEGKSHVQVTH